MSSYLESDFDEILRLRHFLAGFEDPLVRPGLPAPEYRGEEPASPAELHQAGLDAPIIRAGVSDVMTSDPSIGPDPAPWPRGAHEPLPQLGPPFVAYVHEKLSRLERLAENSLKRWQWQPYTFFAIASFTADASGNVKRTTHLNSIFLDPPPGMTMALHRLSIFAGDSAAFTFGVPYTSAGGYWELRVNDEAIDGGSLVSGAGSLPVVRTWGTRDAPHVRDGEVGSIFVVGGAGLAGKPLTVKAQGTFEREPDA